MVQFFQYIAAGLSWLLLKAFTDIEITGEESLEKLRQPLLIVANHESHLDPQLLGVALLGRPSLFPLRYMAKRPLFYYPGFNLMIWLLGAFMVVRGRGLQQNLLTPRRILENKGTVIMFPEGRIIPERGHLAPGKHGAAALALMTNATVLPLSLHTPHRLNFWQFLFTRRSRKKIVIRIGEPFTLDAKKYPDSTDATLDAATLEMMAKISALYHQHDYGQGRSSGN